MTWHAEEDHLRRYLSNSLDEVNAWSLEAHLDACSGCREHLATLSAGSTVATIVDTVHEQLRLDQQDRVWLRGQLRRFRMLVGPGWRLSWLFGAAAMLLIAVVLDASIDGNSQPALSSVAPALPLLGVALSFGRMVDPMYEMTLATPNSGLRLLLWRTAGILAVTVPVALVVGACAGSDPAAWLLPCLGLTVGALALGTVMDIGKAAITIGSVWAVAVATLAAVGTGTSVATAGPLPLLWILVILLAAATVAVRRRYYYQSEAS